MRSSSRSCASAALGAKTALIGALCYDLYSDQGTLCSARQVVVVANWPWRCQFLFALCCADDRQCMRADRHLSSCRTGVRPCERRWSLLAVLLLFAGWLVSRLDMTFAGLADGPAPALLDSDPKRSQTSFSTYFLLLAALALARKLTSRTSLARNVLWQRNWASRSWPEGECPIDRRIAHVCAPDSLNTAVLAGLAELLICRDHSS